MNLIKSHKIVTATILVGIIGSAVGITVINQPTEPVDRHIQDAQSTVKPIDDHKERGLSAEPADKTKPEEIYSPIIEPVLEAKEVEIVPEEPLTLSKDEAYAVAYNELRDMGYHYKWASIGSMPSYILKDLQSNPATAEDIKERTRLCVEYADAHSESVEQIKDFLRSVNNKPCWSN